MSAPPPRRAVRFDESTAQQQRAFQASGEPPCVLTTEELLARTHAQAVDLVNARGGAYVRRWKRQLKIALLDSLDFVTVKSRTDLTTAERCQLLRDYLEEGCPIAYARERAPLMKDETIAAALAAWPATAGAKAKRRTHDGVPVQRKMQAAADLLSEMGIDDADENALAVLWSQLGPPAWRAEKDPR